MKKVDCYNIFIYRKMSKETYYQKQRDVILKRAKDCYENDKERLKEQAKKIYKKLYEEEKNIKREYGRNRYHNVSKEEKKKLKEYEKKLLLG